jgi:uncharacterized membrane protein YphA (DoxX/SURF4 family)
MSRYRIVRWLFPRLLAAVYAITFVSWAWQWLGLFGENGLLPVREWAENLRTLEAEQGLPLWAPSLLRWTAIDGQLLCWLGFSLALLVFCGRLQGPLLLALWVVHLSIVTAAEPFSGFQWDALLLEAGLLAVFLAPWRFRQQPADDPPWPAVWLLHWLLFRLMFLSGLVKIAGGDRSWIDLTALTFHYETQPLPNAVAWFVHHLPRSLHLAGCALMHAIELALPFAIFCGRRGRLAAATGFILLMALVFLTGNYTYFNLLTAALSLTLLDDSCWPARLRAWLGLGENPPPPRWHRRQWPSLAFALPCLLLTLTATDQALAARLPAYHRCLPEWLHTTATPSAGLRSFNAYGLFQSMTRERLELVLEVSDDGALWLPVEFRWKPGDPERAPGFVAPHQPRLDWQMWFAALYPGYHPTRDNRLDSPLAWFGRLARRLLESSAPVWDLLGPPPLPPENIRHVRAQLYRYRFSTPEQRRTTGAWWTRERLGPWSPIFSAPPRQ